MKMETDVNRFRRIVRGRIKKELGKFIANGDLVGQKGGRQVTIPLPRIQMPRFEFGDPQKKGVGQGEGKPGDPLGPAKEPGEAGNSAGAHSMDVDVDLGDLASILGEELELPRIEDKGKKNIRTKKYQYKGVLRNGPESLKNFKRTFKESLKRQIAAGEYNPEDPKIIPIKEDKRYRTFQVQEKPETNAVIIYMMDVSGSMGDEQKHIVRLTAFWIDAWLRHNYAQIETRYIIHDATAREVDEKTFYHTKESGGTLISSAYHLCQSIMEREYPIDQWNVYIFHFSDGDNWSQQDTLDCMSLLTSALLPASNMFCYGQVESRYGSGQFMRDLEKHFGADQEKLLMHQIKDREGIMGALKCFLGKGA